MAPARDLTRRVAVRIHPQIGQHSSRSGFVRREPTGAGAASAIARHDRGDQAPDQNPEKETESHLDLALDLQFLLVTLAVG